LLESRVLLFTDDYFALFGWKVQSLLRLFLATGWLNVFPHVEMLTDNHSKQCQFTIVVVFELFSDALVLT
jgi:hypothetical protein